MQRYMVVEHKHAEADLKLVDGKVEGKLPIHGYLSNYHWARLDETHVICIGSFPAHHHNDIHNHEKVTVLPHVGSSRMLRQHVVKNGKSPNKIAHLASLCTALDVDHNGSIDDVIDAVVSKHGPCFAVQT